MRVPAVVFQTFAIIQNLLLVDAEPLRPTIPQELLLDGVRSDSHGVNHATLPLNYSSIFTGYFITIEIGTPPQPMTISLDIGSAETWVESVDCTTILCSDQDTRYNSSISSTFVSDGRTFGEATLWIEAEGILSQDTFQFGSIASPLQVFQEATSMWPIGLPPFPDELRSLNGVLGLTPFANGSALQTPSPFQQLVDSKLLERNLITLRLVEPAEVSFGRINEDAYSGDVKQLRLSRETDDTDPGDRSNPPVLTGRWQTPASQISLQGQQSASWSLSGLTASFTTGHPFMMIPWNVWMDIGSRLGIELDQRLPLRFPCVRRSYFPDIILNLDGHDFVLSGHDYTLEWHVAWDPPWDPQPPPPGQCALAFYPYNSDKAIVLGSTFLKNFYSILDLDNEQIGLAQLADS